MTYLSSHLDSFDFLTAESVVAFRDLINTAQTRITFWGAHVVEVPGYQSSVSFEDLEEKVGEMMLNSHQTIAGYHNEICNRVINLSMLTPDQIRSSPLVTRKLYKIRIVLKSIL